jgi:hypothetical protein
MSGYEALFACWESGRLPQAALEEHLRADRVLAAWWRRKVARVTAERRTR